MRIPENCPTKTRVIQGDAYAEAGMEDFAFSIPRPFTPEDFVAAAEKYAVSAVGLANMANQTLTENLGNNMASRVKSVLARNERATEDDELESLPGQEDMDELIAAYDFSGVRVSSGTGVSLSPLEKALYHYARAQVRNILRENGYDKLDIPAPCTVAKKGEEPKAGQVSYEVYEEEVAMLAEGEGLWAENEDYADFRQEFVVEPAEAKVAADEKASVSVSQKLGLLKTAA